MSLINNWKSIIVGLAIGAAFGLAGCGVDDIQLNGKIFEATGLTTNSAPKKTPKMAERSGLIVPPSLDKLPEPGSGEAQQGLADLQDHDAKRQVSVADQQKAQVAYCDKNYTDAKIRGDQDAELAVGPMGPCRSSALSALKALTNNSDDK